MIQHAAALCYSCCIFEETGAEDTKAQVPSSASVERYVPAEVCEQQPATNHAVMGPW